jgi:polar amino acid transport system substrate-binding protein
MAAMMRLTAVALVAAGMALAIPASAQVAPTGTLRAAFIETNPVQGRVDPVTKAVTGPVADLVAEYARRLGVPFTIAPMPSAGAVIDHVNSGRADIGFIAREAARAAFVEFSEPYLLMGNAYLVRADSPIVRTSDVDRAGTTVGAVKGQTQQLFVSEHLTAAKVVILPSMGDDAALVGLLTRREVDAIAANRQRAEEVARSSPAVRVLPDNFLLIGQAVALKKGDRARLAEVDRFIAEIRATDFVARAIARAGLSGVEPAPPLPR